MTWPGRPRREDVLATAVVAIAIGGAVTLGSFVLVERAFEPQDGPFGIPHRIPTCGRSYLGGQGSISIEQIQSTITPGASPVVFEPVLGMLPLWAPFDASRVRLDTGGEVCTTVVFLHVGPDAYAAYGLEGGP